MPAAGRTAFLLMAAVVATFAAVGAHARLYHNVAAGLAIYNDFGDFLHYIIFAEENAPLTPVPQIEILNTELARDRDIRQNMVERPVNPVSSPKFLRYGLRQNGQSFTKSETFTVDIFRSISRTVQVAKTSFMTWFVRSAPFGALSAVGPKRFYSNDQSFFPLTGLRFRTAGRYEVVFNVSMITGKNFHFNRTIFVQRQPNALVHGTTVAGYNGSAFFPLPTGQLVDFTGAVVRTSTATVDLQLEALPSLGAIRGQVIRGTTYAGRVEFPDVVPSIPGPYTFRLRATLSDGSILTTPSQQVIVERALPVTIIVHRTITGIARFQFFTQPLFSIRDSAGPSQDPRSNMTLSIAQNSPDFSYEGYNTIASLSGNISVDPVNYRYTFTDVAIDLPGNYIVRATLELPTGATLSQSIAFRLNNPPTFEIVSDFVVNNPGTITLHGTRPPVSSVILMLALDQACTRPTSDRVPWPETATGDVFNITIVPFNAQPSYVCMAIPSHPTFAPLIQRYLPQYDELFPLVFTFPVADVTECRPLTALEANAYANAGWDSVAALRRYGCKLSPPVAGTIPACSCPRPLTCAEMRHELFTPPNLDIGQCVCCEVWVLVVAGCVAGAFFLAVMAVIVTYV